MEPEITGNVLGPLPYARIRNGMVGSARGWQQQLSCEIKEVDTATSPVTLHLRIAYVDQGLITDSAFHIRPNRYMENKDEDKDKDKDKDMYTDSG